MLFNSLAFLVFMPIVFALYWLIPQKGRWILLLIASYYFYMSWNPKYVVLILGTTVVSYAAGLLLENLDSRINMTRLEDPLRESCKYLPACPKALQS